MSRMRMMETELEFSEQESVGQKGQVRRIMGMYPIINGQRVF
jgi:hypothetical protein